MIADGSQNSFLDSARDADQLEFVALIKGEAAFDAGVTDDVMSGQIEDETTTQTLTVTHAIESDCIVESETSASLDVIRSRARILGQDYPFEVKEGFICYRGSATFVYEFCLAVALQTDVRTAPFNQLPVAFERMVAHVICIWMGNGASWYRTGWPPNGDRPTKFREAIEELSRLSGEFEWNGVTEDFSDPAVRDLKDGGLDVVVWRLPDTRPGGVFLAGQCSCGNDWPSKLTDLNFTTLKSLYLRRTTVTDEVLRFFATPFDLGHEATWRKASASGGMVFDRLRITALAESHEHCDRVVELANSPYDDLVRIVSTDFQSKIRRSRKRRTKMSPG